jgi:hypothetical protein
MVIDLVTGKKRRRRFATGAGEDRKKQRGASERIRE